MTKHKKHHFIFCCYPPPPQIPETIIPVIYVHPHVITSNFGLQFLFHYVLAQCPKKSIQHCKKAAVTQ